MGGGAVALLLAALSLGIAALAGLWWWGRQWRRERAALASDLGRLQGAVDAMISGAAGVDRRSGRLEQRLHELQRRIENLEASRQVSRPYDEAIRLVRQGAGAERLVQELGLSRSEADLLIMLHGARETPH